MAEVKSNPKYYLEEGEFLTKASQFADVYYQKLMDMYYENPNRSLFSRKEIQTGMKEINQGADDLSAFGTTVKKLKLLGSTGLFWSDFSLSDNPDPEEIILRALIREIYGANLICYSYLTHKTKLDEELIRSLIFINSGFFSFSEWTVENEKMAAFLIKQDEEELQEIFMSIAKNPKKFGLDKKSNLVLGIKRGITQKEASIQRHQHNLLDASKKLSSLQEMKEGKASISSEVRIRIQKKKENINSMIADYMGKMDTLRPNDRHKKDKEDEFRRRIHELENRDIKTEVLEDEIKKIKAIISSLRKSIATEKISFKVVDLIDWKSFKDKGYSKEFMNEFATLINKQQYLPM